MSKHPAGHRGWESAEQSLSKKVLCNRGGCAFPGGTSTPGSPQRGRAVAVREKQGTRSPRPRARVCCRAETNHGGASPVRGAFGHTWLPGRRRAAPTHLPKKARLRNPSNCSFPFLSPAPKRRSGGLKQRAWACRKSRILVLGCISRTDTSEQHFLPIRVMEAANNPGMPRLCTAQLSASCLFLGGRGATGRAHFLAIIEKRNCADRSS